MWLKGLKKYYKKTMKIRTYNNIIEALYLSSMIRKLSGISIFLLMLTPDNRVVKKFSLLGFLCFLIWYSLYFYSTYIAQSEHQTILRTLYNTKLKRYGDDFEGISSTIFVIFAMWKIPHNLSCCCRSLEIIINADQAFEKMGENIDYNKDAFSALRMSLGQMFILIFRTVSVCVTLGRLNVPIPAERIYQVIFSDALAFIATSHFCFFLIVFQGRFRCINKVLEDIKSHKSWEYKIFVRGPMSVNVVKARGLEDRYICEKIKTCAKTYGKLYKVIEETNKQFGTMLMMTTMKSLSYIILYMFYFMEATAAGSFHDVPRYIAFSIYVFWQIVYTIVVIFVIVYFCECTMFEAQSTSYIIHEIMNSDFSAAVKTEAMQLSMQFLHQKPVFTACGLYELNYGLLHQSARSVATYLVILLQFVTEAY